MENGLLTTLALHLDHRLAPGDSPVTSEAVGDILCRQPFDALRRVAVNVKDRDKLHQEKSASSVSASLLAADSDAAVLDSGRQGELLASARIWTGRHVWTYDEPKPFLASYVTVPYDPQQREALVDAFVDLASALEAVAGYVAVEKGHDRAHRAALSQAPRREDVRDFPRRAKERKGHYWRQKNVQTEIAGPDWGLILSREHVKRIPSDNLRVFPIRRAVTGGLFVFLSADPEDALQPEFDDRLQDARNALAPVLMDLSSVPVR